MRAGGNSAPLTAGTSIVPKDASIIAIVNESTGNAADNSA
jgi:hypothetical protein